MIPRCALLPLLVISNSYRWIDWQDIDLVHARLHTLANLRLPRFGVHLKRLCLRQNFIAEVGDEDVGPLEKLEELDLYDNKLKGVGSALDKMKDLK
jgi:protein phosphatase 1 regulatory subunit 7